LDSKIRKFLDGGGLRHAGMGISHAPHRIKNGISGICAGGD